MVRLAACMTHDKAGLFAREDPEALGTSSHNDGDLLSQKADCIEKRDIRHRLRRTRVADCRL